MKHYIQLTLEKRYGIYSLLKTDHTQSKIAEVLGVHKSTISREIKRNIGQRNYRPKQAHNKAIDRRQGKVRSYIEKSTWDFIEILIKNEWSPEQIHGWMKENLIISVSHERIYTHIYQDKDKGGNLYTHLRGRKRYRKRNGSNDRRGQIKNRVSIDERPDVVEQRSRIGDWEADTIIGKAHKQAIVSLTERKSGLALIYKVERRTKEKTEEAIKQMLLTIREKVH
ncbi:MAG: IS30 family transposase, partial [Candidatus Marinimicrobia bacterium]|nr:IS30 family transposase [Candidatus Neomarinimicrobiota bacterium]